ncbi:MAG: prolipoprotein diacylglyceryl transferase [Bdellovibrionales bacterium]|nr:prolipoprotein diacylglyceryl transferase [Bdellovibrionales bacterium]
MSSNHILAAVLPIHPVYLHTLDPFAIEFTDGIGIRWYGLAYLTGFLLGYWSILWLSRRSTILLKTADLSDFVFSVALGCILGGRIGYCLFYDPTLFITIFPDLPYWGVLAVNHGGMASHGGMIGIVIACYIFARKRGIPVPHLFDLTIFGATLGIFFGRIANFINGELVGRPASENYWLAVKFPQDILSWPKYNPEKLADLAPVVKQLGVAPSEWLQWIALQRPQVDSLLQRIVDEVQNNNILVRTSLEPLLTPRYPSQLFAAFLEGLLLFLFLFWVWRKPRKPGVITGLFFSGYAIVRIIGEFYRRPDLHLGYQFLSLTRGQWLSVGLFAVGIASSLYWRSRPSEPLGGWRDGARPEHSAEEEEQD